MIRLRKIKLFKLAVCFWGLVILMPSAGCSKQKKKDFSYSVAGQVLRIDDNSGLESVEIIFSDGSIVYTDSEGRWSKEGLIGETTITAAKEGCFFFPGCIEVTSSREDIMFYALESPDASEVSGTINMLEMGRETITISSAYSTDVRVDEQGTFSAVVSGEAPQLLFAENSKGEICGLSISLPGEANISIEAQNTAAALVFLTAGIITNNPDEASVRIEQIKALPSFNSLVALIREKIISGVNLFSDEEVISKVIQCSEEWLMKYYQKEQKTTENGEDNYSINATGINIGTNHLQNWQKCRFTAEVVDPSDLRKTKVELINFGWRYVNIYRRDLRNGQQTGVTNIANGIFAMGGEEPFDEASGPFHKETTTKIDYIDFSPGSGATESEYWIFGPGFKGSTDLAPAELKNVNLSNTYILSLTKYVFVPFLSIVLGKLEDENVFYNILSIIYDNATNSLGITQKVVDLQKLVSEGKKWEAAKKACAILLDFVDIIKGKVLEEALPVYKELKGFFSLGTAISNTASMVGSWIVLPEVASIRLETVYTERPTAPTDLKLISTSSRTIELSWRDTSDVTQGFKVERALLHSGPYHIVTMWEGSPGKGKTVKYTDTGLAPGTTYYYKISAFNMAGESSISGYQTTPESIKSPANLKGKLISSNEIRLEWDDKSNNETGFIIERKTNLWGPDDDYGVIDTCGTNVKYYHDTSNVFGDYYYSYRVKAYNDTDESEYSNEYFVFTIHRPEIKLTKIGPEGYPLLTWKDLSKYEYGYMIERKLLEDPNWVQIATMVRDRDYVDNEEIEFTDSGTVREKIYQHRVRGYNADGYSTYSEISTFALMNPPTDLAVEVDTTTASLSWSDNSSIESGYIIYRKMIEEEDWTEVGVVKVGIDYVDGQPTVYDFGLSAGRTYHYRVRAYNNENNSYSESQDSNIFEITVPSGSVIIIID